MGANEVSSGAIQVGILPVHSPYVEPDELKSFLHSVIGEVKPAMETATGQEWELVLEAPVRLSDNDSRAPTDFLDSASLRLVEGPYDAILVVTDVGLVSRKQQLVPGLASVVSRVAVLSTRDIRNGPRGQAPYELGSEPVRWNAAALLMHLLGHLLGLEHGASAGTVMSRFSFDPSRHELPEFTRSNLRRLRQSSFRFPEREDFDEGTLSEVSFHISSALRHPKKVLLPPIRSRALLLPLRLPRLATAAVAPALILVFTAEIWDAGFHMKNYEVWGFALLSILAATGYLVLVQHLFFPRKERRYHTEHLAVANVAVLLSILAAVVGLFTMIGLLMLGIQLFIFPPDLIREWPSLEIVRFTMVDQLRIAALISTVGVLTGALGGGLESREVIRHLALFEAEP